MSVYGNPQHMMLWHVAPTTEWLRVYVATNVLLDFRDLHAAITAADATGAERPRTIKLAADAVLRLNRTSRAYSIAVRGERGRWHSTRFNVG